MTERIHHISCATMCPTLGRVPRLAAPRMVAHCLVVEGPLGLTLVDTGFGTADVADPAARLGRAFLLATGARMSGRDTALAQIRELGYDPADVRDIVVTHLDLDHAGGLGDFPWARVHVRSAELEQARAQATRKDRERFRQVQWAHGPQWVEHGAGGDDWFGFDAVRAVGEDVLLVPLPGHTRGHSGVAVRRPGAGWLLHAGDAYFNAGEKLTPPSCPPGLRVFQSFIQTDGAARVANQERLRTLHATHGGEVTVFCAHDVSEYEALVDSTD